MGLIPDWAAEDVAGITGDRSYLKRKSLSQDEDLAVRTVIGEARNEGERGWKAVAGVIRNRANQAGQSFKDVVLAPNQFEPWGARKKELESIDPNSPIYRRVADTILPVLNGQADDPTGGATHFYAPKAQAALGRSKPTWDNGSGVDIGNHRFFKLGYGKGKPPAKPDYSFADKDVKGLGLSDYSFAHNDIASILGDVPKTFLAPGQSLAPDTQTPDTPEEGANHPLPTREQLQAGAITKNPPTNVDAILPRPTIAQTVAQHIVAQPVAPTVEPPVAQPATHPVTPSVAQHATQPANLSKIDPTKLFGGNVKVSPKVHTDVKVDDGEEPGGIDANGNPIDAQGRLIQTPKTEVLGTVDVDPKWSDEAKVRYAANHLLVGKDTPTGKITPDDIEKWIADSKATGDPDALVQGNRDKSTFSIYPNMLEQIWEAKKKTPEQLNEEAKQRTIAPPTEEGYKEQAIKDLVDENRLNLLARLNEANPNAKDLTDEQIKEALPGLLTQDEINAKVDQLKSQELSPEAKSRAYDVAQRNEGTPGAALSGLYGGAGSGIHTLAGVLRPFSGVIPGYDALKDTGKEMQLVSAYRNKGQGAKNVGESIAQFAGETIPQLGEMIALPGGAVGKFAFLGGAKSAGAGEPVSKIAKATGEGALTGQLFKTAEGIEKPIARLGTVFGGSMAINAAMGVPLDQNVQKSLVNTAFELQNVYGAKALDKVYRFWHGGDPFDVHVTPKGEMDLLPTDPNRNITGGEVVTDPSNKAYPSTIKAIHQEVLKPLSDAAGDDLNKKKGTLVDAVTSVNTSEANTKVPLTAESPENTTTQPTNEELTSRESSRANPFRDAAINARAAYQKASQPTEYDKAMEQSFPLGVGYGRPGADKRIDATVNRAVQATELQRRAEMLERKADAFDRGEINAQGRPPAANADEAKAKRLEKKDLFEQAKAARVGKAKWEVPVETVAHSEKVFGGRPMELVRYEHEQAVKQALSEGKPVPPEVLADYPDLAQKYRTETNPQGTAPTVTHPDPAINGKPIVATRDDGKVVVPNENNKSGVSVVTDRGDAAIAPKAAEQVVKQQPDELKPFEKNKIITADAVQAARERLAKKSTQLNTGIDPADLKDYAIIAGAHIEAGARKFGDFSKKMVDEFGDAIKPHLEKLYGDVRKEHNFDGMEKYDGVTGKPIGTKTSKVGQSIEAKTIADDLTKGFEGTSEYDPVTVKEQAKKATDLVNNELDTARAIVGGKQKLPHGLRAAPVIDALERYARKQGDVELLRELANSPLVAETSLHAQELRLLRERHPYSPVKLIEDVQKARQEASRKRYKNQTVKDVVDQIKRNVPKAKPKDWASLVETLKCK